MARINIEDELFKDSRFFELALKLGSKTLALGALVEAFIVGQKHYADETNDRLIPFDDWKKQGLCDAIIDVGLAIKKEKGIYICGAESQFKWYAQRIEASKKGGQRMRQKYQADREPTGSRPGAYDQADRKPSYSFSNSFSNSEIQNTKKLNTTLGRADREPTGLAKDKRGYVDTDKSHDQTQQTLLEPEIVSNGHDPDLNQAPNERKRARAARKAPSEGVGLWETYKTAYNAKYGVEPVRNAKVNGQLSQLAKRLGVTEGCQVIEFYLQHNDAWYLKNAHSTDALLRDAEKLRTEMLIGTRLTSDRVKKVEAKQEINDAFAQYIKRDEAKRVSHD